MKDYINDRDEDDKSVNALKYACDADSFDVIDYFLDNGANMNLMYSGYYYGESATDLLSSLSSQSEPPSHIAASMSSTSIVELI